MFSLPFARPADPHYIAARADKQYVCGNDSRLSS